MKKDTKGLEDAIAKLKALENASVTYGIFGRNAQMVDKDEYNQSKSRGIKIGLLARILEQGRTFKHKGGVIHFVNHAGEEKWWNIPAGKWISIPPRPFFALSHGVLKRILPSIFKIQFLLYWKNKNSIENMLNQIGTTCRETVRKTINEAFFLPIGPLQAWKKGGCRPLFDKGTLYNAVDFKTKFKKMTTKK